jgi:ATP-binding cassette subfamily B protein
MTSSAEAARAIPDALPPGLQSMWRLCKLGYGHEPALLSISFGLVLAAALPDALLAFWFKLLGDGVAQGDPGLIRLAVVALGVSAVATWCLGIVSTRVQRRFRDRVTIALEAHVARLQATIVTVAHQERPDYLDRLSVLRHQVFVLDHMYMSLFSTCGWILRLGVTVALLVSIHPALALLALFAVPTVLTSAWRPGVERAAQERGAQAARLSRHLFTVATTPASAKDVRLAGIAERVARERRSSWERWYGPVAAARTASSYWHAGAWALFAAAFAGALVFVTAGLRTSAGNVLLLVAAGARLAAYIGATVGEVGFLRGFWMDGSRRLAWLEDYAGAVAGSGHGAPPVSLREGIRFDAVSFAYPGTTRPVLEDVSLAIPAGAVVAVVGENGAGKSTLVKLLARMYDPSAGRITVDGTDLAELDPGAWRTRLSGAFQDFFRFELTIREAVGLGAVDRLGDDEAIGRAMARAGASSIMDGLPAGLDTQLGPAWPGGVDLSFGQWQKLALARGFMRDSPLLLILDEPTSALDAETEHALFEQYAAAARARDAPSTGRITLLVSHRFSTVRMADLIVVLDGARVVESGSHAELVARGGQYAQLYRIQAAAYR